MKKLALLCIGSGLFATSAMAENPYETWLIAQHNRGTEIELIRVANEKTPVATEETDAEVASILEEVEAIEANNENRADTDESAKQVD